jgi:hypothetical protein
MNWRLSGKGIMFPSFPCLHAKRKSSTSRRDSRAGQEVFMGDNATATIVAVALFGALASLAFSINAIARAWVARGRDEARLASDPSAQLTDARLARLEQAVDAIALEMERMSEAQRFTAKLLNDQGRVAPTPIRRQLSSDTPT